MTAFRVERDPDSAAFFDGTTGGTLLIRRCEMCGTYSPPAAHRCRLGHELGWVASSGRGRLVAWAVDRSRPLDPALAIPDGSASAFGYVELAEGPWIQVPLVGVEPTSLCEGADMTVTFVRPGDGEAIPAFTLA
jgi:uncharacterized protein